MSRQRINQTKEVKSKHALIIKKVITDSTMEDHIKGPSMLNENNTVNKHYVDAYITDIKYYEKFIEGRKVVACDYKLRNGFVGTLTSAAVLNENCDFETGKKILRGQVEDIVWKGIGFMLGHYLYSDNDNVLVEDQREASKLKGHFGPPAEIEVAVNKDEIKTVPCVVFTMPSPIEKETNSLSFSEWVEYSIKLQNKYVTVDELLKYYMSLIHTYAEPFGSFYSEAWSMIDKYKTSKDSKTNNELDKILCHDIPIQIFKEICSNISTWTYTGGKATFTFKGKDYVVSRSFVFEPNKQLIEAFIEDHLNGERLIKLLNDNFRIGRETSETIKSILHDVRCKLSSTLGFMENTLAIYDMKKKNAVELRHRLKELKCVEVNNLINDFEKSKTMTVNNFCDVMIPILIKHIVDVQAIVDVDFVRLEYILTGKTVTVGHTSTELLTNNKELILNTLPKAISRLFSKGFKKEIPMELTSSYLSNHPDIINEVACKMLSDKRADLLNKIELYSRCIKNKKCSLSKYYDNKRHLIMSGEATFEDLITIEAGDLAKLLSKIIDSIEEVKLINDKNDKSYYEVIGHDYFCNMEEELVTIDKLKVLVYKYLHNDLLAGGIWDNIIKIQRSVTNYKPILNEVLKNLSEKIDRLGMVDA